MDFSKTNQKPRVPVNPMGKRYVDIHQKAEPGSGPRPSGSKAKAQLRRATKTAANVSGLATDFLNSVAILQEKYAPRKEPFHPARPGENAWEEKYLNNYMSEKVVTSHVAARARKGGIRLDGQGKVEVEYVDREIKPVRTTKGHKPKESGVDLRLDLLLAQGDQPVVAEVKCRGDENAYYALIQSLAAAAQLSSDLQRKRLAWAYRDEIDLSETKPLAVWIILCQHNSRGKEKREMYKLTKQISTALMKNAEFTSYVSEIRCVWATLDKPGPIELRNQVDGDLQGWCAK